MIDGFIDTLWRVSLQAGILALVVWGVSRLAKNAPARLRYALWVLVLVKFLMPPLAWFPQQIAFWQERPEVRVVDTLPVPAPGVLPADPSAASDSPGYAEPHGTRASSLVGIDWRFAVVVLWLAGAGAMCVRLALRFRQQRRLLAGSVAAGDELVAVLNDASDELRISHLPKIRISETAPTAMLLGLFRPSILLPGVMVDSCSWTDIRAILLHELAHIKRMDLLVTWLHQLAQVIFFFHPALWLVGREVRRERELACDEHVLTRSGIRAEEYAAGYMAALRLAVRIPVPSSVAMAEPLHFENKRLISMMSPISVMSRRWVILLLMVALVGLPTYAGVRYIGKASAEHPTAEFLAAALREQEAKLPRSLDIQYTREFTRFKDGQFVDVHNTDFHYIRSLKAQRMEEFREYGESKSHYEINIHSYDIAERERRSWTKSVKPESYVWCGPVYKGDSLEDSQLLEPIRYPLYEGVLIDRIPYGSVSPNMEVVDGHKCWRVEIPAYYPSPEKPRLEKYIVWLDPDIGYNPRKIVYPWNDRKVPYIISFVDYRNYGEFWFPDRMIMTYSRSDDESWTFSYINTITRIRTGEPMTTEELMRSP